MTELLYETPGEYSIGRLLLQAEGGRIVGVRMTEASLMFQEEEAPSSEDFEVLTLLRGELDRYFAGRLWEFTVPVGYVSGANPDVPPFRQRVWDAMTAVPYGTTCTYGALAAMAGNPRACRAAGSACHRNRLLILRPCHRIVASGGLGGFAGRLDIKKTLLRLEGVEIFE